MVPSRAFAGILHNKFHFDIQSNSSSKTVIKSPTNLKGFHLQVLIYWFILMCANLHSPYKAHLTCPLPLSHSRINLRSPGQTWDCQHLLWDKDELQGEAWGCYVSSFKDQDRVGGTDLWLLAPLHNCPDGEGQHPHVVLDILTNIDQVNRVSLPHCEGPPTGCFWSASQSVKVKRLWVSVLGCGMGLQNLAKCLLDKSKLQSLETGRQLH